jgi:hypothetical protein
LSGRISRADGGSASITAIGMVDIDASSTTSIEQPITGVMPDLVRCPAAAKQTVLERLSGRAF